jgi:hypothetical protein
MIAAWCGPGGIALRAMVSGGKALWTNCGVAFALPRTVGDEVLGDAVFAVRRFAQHLPRAGGQTADDKALPMLLGCTSQRHMRSTATLVNVWTEDPGVIRISPSEPEGSGWASIPGLERRLSNEDATQLGQAVRDGWVAAGRRGD